MLQAALLGGIFTGVLSALPFVSIGNCCCLWILGGGAIAAYLDQQNNPSRQPTTPARGAMAGAAAGVVSAFVWLFVAMAMQSVIGPMQERLMQEILSTARDVTPDVRQILESFGQGRSPLGWAVGFFFMLCIGTIFSAIGGAVGAVFFKNDVPPALGGPIPPPPLP